MSLSRWLGLGLVLLVAGCSEYVTPGRGANFSQMGLSPESQKQGTDFSMQQAFDRKPMASWPASVAVVRIQDHGYRSRNAEGWGAGAYSIVTTREVEKDEDFARLAKLPQVDGIAPLGRALFMGVGAFQDDREIRKAAAKIQADLVVIYTLDTTFWVREMAAPVSVITLGLSPTQQARVTTTASAVILDTRNGYIYGMAEATDQYNRPASAWTSDDAVDAARLQTERKAFEKLIGEMEKTWTGVVKRYAPTTQAAG